MYSAALALLALLLPSPTQEDRVRALLERLDDASPEVRDAAEKELEGHLAASTPLLLRALDDSRSEVRIRVLRLMKSAPPEPLFRALASKAPEDVRRAARALAGRPVRADLSTATAFVETCKRHSTPFEIAREFASAVPVHLAASAWAEGLSIGDLRTGNRTPAETLVGRKILGGDPTLRFEAQDGVVVAGTDAEREALRKEPPFLPVLNDLISPDRRRRELAARCLGALSDDGTFGALVRLGADWPPAREVAVWAALLSKRVRTREMNLRLNEAIADDRWALAAAAANSIRGEPVDESLFTHAGAQARFLAVHSSRGRTPALRARLEDPEAEIRLAAYNQIVPWTDAADLPLQDLLRSYRSLPEALWPRAYSISTEKHAGAVPAATEMLAAREPRDRALGILSLTRSKNEELIDRALSAAAAEREPAVLERIVQRLGSPDLCERPRAIEILARRAGEGDAQALQGLGQGESGKTLEAFLGLLSHPSESVRLSAAPWLRRWTRGDHRDRVVRALQDRAALEPSKRVREAIEAALEPPGETRYLMRMECPACQGRVPGVYVDRPSFSKGDR